MRMSLLPCRQLKSSRDISGHILTPETSWDIIDKNINVNEIDIDLHKANLKRGP